MVCQQNIMAGSLERLRTLQNWYCEGRFEWGSHEHSELLSLEELESFLVKLAKELITSPAIAGSSGKLRDPASLLRKLGAARTEMVEVGRQIGYDEPESNAAREVANAIDRMAELVMSGTRDWFWEGLGRAYGSARHRNAKS